MCKFALFHWTLIHDESYASFGTHANLVEALMSTKHTAVNVDPNDGRVLMVGGWLDDLQSMFFEVEKVYNLSK